MSEDPGRPRPIGSHPIYIDRPRASKILDKALRSFIYLISAGIGLVQMVRVDQPYDTVIPLGFSTANGAALFVLSMVAALATSEQRIRLEYGVIWFLTGAFTGILWPLWFLVANQGYPHLSFALACSLIFVFLAYRGFRLSLEVKALTVLRKVELQALLQAKEEHESRAARNGD